MESTILVALLALVGTALGSISGIITANRLVSHRLNKLEQKVDRHNNMIERLYKVEAKIDAIEDKHTPLST